MSEPITLYPKHGDEYYVCASPSFAKTLLASGEWSLTAPATQSVKPAASTASREPVEAWNGLATALVKALMEAGYTSPDVVRALSDEEIIAVKGLGEKALARIREALG